MIEFRYEVTLKYGYDDMSFYFDDIKDAFVFIDSALNHKYYDVDNDEKREFAATIQLIEVEEVE